MALPSHSGSRPSFQFRNHFSQTVGLLGCLISPSQGRYLNTGQHKHRIKAYTKQLSLLWVGLELTITASERAKKVHALKRAATVTGNYCNKDAKLLLEKLTCPYQVINTLQLLHGHKNRDSAANIATGYGLDGFRVQVEARYFSSPCHPDRFWGPTSLLFTGTEVNSHERMRPGREADKLASSSAETRIVKL
jgi:hypothetical protein